MANNLLLYDNGRDFQEENGYVSLAWVGSHWNDQTGEQEDIYISGRTYTDEYGFTFNFEEDGLYLLDKENKEDLIYEGCGDCITEEIYDSLPNKGDRLAYISGGPVSINYDDKYPAWFKASGYDDLYIAFNVLYDEMYDEGEPIRKLVKILTGAGQPFGLFYSSSTAYASVGEGVNFGFLTFKEDVNTFYVAKIGESEWDWLGFVKSGDTDYYYYEETQPNISFGKTVVQSGTSCFVPNVGAKRNMPNVDGKMYNTSGETRTVKIKDTSGETTDFQELTMTIFKTLDGTEEVYASAYTSGDEHVRVIKGNPDAGIWVANGYPYAYNHNSYLDFFDGSFTEHTVTTRTQSDACVSSIYPCVVYEEKDKEVFYNGDRYEEVIWRSPNAFIGSASPETHEDFDELFPKVDEFFKKAKKFKATIYSYYEPGLPAGAYHSEAKGAQYPDPKACNFCKYVVATNDKIIKYIYEGKTYYSLLLSSTGCEDTYVDYDAETRTVSFRLDQKCH